MINENMKERLESAEANQKAMQDFIYKNVATNEEVCSLVADSNNHFVKYTHVDPDKELKDRWADYFESAHHDPIHKWTDFENAKSLGVLATQKVLQQAENKGAVKALDNFQGWLTGKKTPTYSEIFDELSKRQDELRTKYTEASK